jgi:hypothetical protein
VFHARQELNYTCTAPQQSPRSCRDFNKPFRNSKARGDCALKARRSPGRIHRKVSRASKRKLVLPIPCAQSPNSDTSVVVELEESSTQNAPQESAAVFHRARCGGSHDLSAMSTWLLNMSIHPPIRSHRIYWQFRSEAAAPAKEGMFPAAFYPYSTLFSPFLDSTAAKRQPTEAATHRRSGSLTGHHPPSKNDRRLC